MASKPGELYPRKRRKRGPDDEMIKNVVVLRSGQVSKKDGVVLMPKTTLDMSEIKKKGQSKKISFTKSTTSTDIRRKLEAAFPFLAEASERYYCAKAVDNRSNLDFSSEPGIWSGEFIHKMITGNSALYIYCEEKIHDEYPSLAVQIENIRISANVDSSDTGTCSDSGFDTSGISQDISSNQREGPCLGNTSSPAASSYDEASNLAIQLSHPLHEELEKVYNEYSSAEKPMIDPLVDDVPTHYNAEGEEITCCDQEASQENLVQEICPTSGRVEGQNKFHITLHKELASNDESGLAYFGDNPALLKTLNKFTFSGTIPAAQEPGVVCVRVYTDSGQFLGETEFEYKDIMDSVVCQAVKRGSEGVSKLFKSMKKHSIDMWKQSSSVMQNSGSSGQATDSLIDSCIDRSSTSENIGMAEDIIKCLSEESCNPSCSSTNVWLKLAKAVGEICKQLARTEDEHNFKSDQLACSQESEENYFADAENSSCVSSEVDSDSLSDSEDWDESINENSGVNVTRSDEWECTDAKPKQRPSVPEQSPLVERVPQEVTRPGTTADTSQERAVDESHNQRASYGKDMLDAIESSRSEPCLVNCPATSRANENSSLKFSLTGNEQLGCISSATTPAYRPGTRQESRVNQLAYDFLPSTQLTEQEQSVARPMDKPAVRRMEGQSLELEQVPQQMTRPITLGIDHAFLARHSQDRALVESLNQSSREGASYDVHMINDIESSRFNPYVVASRASEHGTLRFSLSPKPRQGLTPGSPGSNISVNRPVYHHAEFVQNSPPRQSLLGSAQLTKQEQLNSRPRDDPAMELRVPGQTTMVELLQEIARPVTLKINIAFLVRHLTDRSLVENCRMNDYQRRDHSLGSPGLHATFSVDASNEDDSEPIPVGDAMETSLHGAVRPDTLLVEAALSSGSSPTANSVESTISSQLGAVGQSVEDEAMEQDVADTWLQLVCSAANVSELPPYAMESLNSVHNSSHTLVLMSMDRARVRSQEREERERAARWWCSCDRGENNEVQEPICYLCFRQRYCGPHSCPYMDHHMCRYCLQDASSGCLILPCSHPVHRECVITLIQGNMLTCPAFGQTFSGLP